MPEIVLTAAELEVAAHVGVRRQIQAMRESRPDRHGYRGDGWSNHIEGAAGEMAVAKLLNRYWNGSVGTFKEGGDVGEIQVRTRSRADYQLIVRPDDRDDDWFILVRGTSPTYSVIGYIRGSAAKREEWLHDYGGRPHAYFVPDDALIAFRQPPQAREERP